MIWATMSSQSCFCWLCRASPSLAENNIINLILVWAVWWCPCVESSLVSLEEGVCYDQCVQSCPTLCDPRDCSLPGSPVHGILQGRILEWVAISVFRRSSWPGVVPRSHTLQAVSLPSEPPGKPWLYSLEGSHHTQFKKSVVLYPIFFKDELSP